MLTPKQKKILDYIKRFIKDNGYSPSIPEIGRHFKLANSTVHEHINNIYKIIEELVSPIYTDRPQIGYKSI
jgi:SOS-response transcriptional repressor LexA